MKKIIIKIDKLQYLSYPVYFWTCPELHIIGDNHYTTRSNCIRAVKRAMEKICDTVTWRGTEFGFEFQGGQTNTYDRLKKAGFDL